MAEPIAIDVNAARSLTAAAEARHADTVMDLGVAGELVATIDFDARWAVWRCSDLQPVASGVVPERVGRHVALAAGGRRLAVLTGTHRVDYQYRAAIVDVATGDYMELAGTYSWLAWVGETLVAIGRTGYRRFDATGRLLTDSFHTPIPGSGNAWMAAAVTRDGARIYYMHYHRLAGVAVADGSALAMPDLAPFARPTGSAAWAFPSLAVTDDGAALALGFLDEALVWRLADGALLARLVPTGVPIVGAHVRCAGGRVIATFEHVVRGEGQRKTVAVYDVAAGQVADALTTAPDPHGGKGGADGDLLVAHGPALTRAR